MFFSRCSVSLCLPGTLALHTFNILTGTPLLWSAHVPVCHDAMFLCKFTCAHMPVVMYLCTCASAHVSPFALLLPHALLVCTIELLLCSILQCSVYPLRLYLCLSCTRYSVPVPLTWYLCLSCTCCAYPVPVPRDCQLVLRKYPVASNPSVARAPTPNSPVERYKSTTMHSQRG